MPPSTVQADIDQRIVWVLRTHDRDIFRNRRPGAVDVAITIELINDRRTHAGKPTLRAALAERLTTHPNRCNNRGLRFRVRHDSMMPESNRYVYLKATRPKTIS